MQTSATPAYEAAEALSRGTLFPGLDLPFMNIVNDTQPVTPLTELMAIDFVTDELELYLDTHADDKEAFSMYQTFLALRKEARCRYAEKYGRSERHARREQLQLAQGSMAVGISEQNGGLSYVCI